MLSPCQGATANGTGTMQSDMSAIPTSIPMNASTDMLPNGIAPMLPDHGRQY